MPGINHFRGEKGFGLTASEVSVHGHWACGDSRNMGQRSVFFMASWEAERKRRRGRRTANMYRGTQPAQLSKTLPQKKKEKKLNDFSIIFGPPRG